MPEVLQRRRWSFSQDQDQECRWWGFCWWVGKPVFGGDALGGGMIMVVVVLVVVEVVGAA